MSGLDDGTLTTALAPTHDLEHAVQVKAAGAIVAIARRHDADPHEVLAMLFAPTGPRRCVECHGPIRTYIGSKAKHCPACAEKRRRGRTT